MDSRARQCLGDGEALSLLSESLSFRSHGMLRGGLGGPRLSDPIERLSFPRRMVLPSEPPSTADGGGLP